VAKFTSKIQLNKFERIAAAAKAKLPKEIARANANEHFRLVSKRLKKQRNFLAVSLLLSVMYIITMAILK